MTYISTQNQPLRAAVVANFLVAELLGCRARPGYVLYLISPWITDFSLAVPAGGDLSALVEGDEPQPRLFEVLRQIALCGGQVRLVVRPERDQARFSRFIEPLLELAKEPGIALRRRAGLHAKIYAGQHGALYGSPNLTESGMERNLEFSSYFSDARNIARLRAEAQSIFETTEELER